MAQNNLQNQRIKQTSIPSSAITIPLIQKLENDDIMGGEIQIFT